MLGLAVIGGGIYFLSKDNNATSQLDVPGNFTTYETEEYSFVYPPNWFVRYNPNTGIGSLTQIANFDPNVLINSPYAREGYFKIEIARLDNPKLLPLDAWISEYIEIISDIDEVTIIDSENLIVDDYDAIRTIQSVRSAVHPVVYIAKDNFVYLIGTSTLTPEFEIVFDKLISSFKFK